MAQSDPKNPKDDQPSTADKLKAAAAKAQVAATLTSTGDPGTGLLLIGLGVVVGYVTLQGMWPLLLLALFYPERLTYK